MSDRSKGNALRLRVREKGKLFLGALLFLAVLTVCVFYIHRTTVPLEYQEIGPAADTERWTFTLADGTELQPQEGRLPLEGADTVVICETVLSGNPRELPLIVVTSKSSDCVFFLEGELLYSPSGRYRDGAFSDEPFSTASGQFGLPELGEEKRLTMLVQFKGEEKRLSRMPKLTLYGSAINYFSQYTGPVSEDALLAGVYFAVALFLAGLFLIGLWKGNRDPVLLLLAFCVLAMAFERTTSYSYGVMQLFGTPTITWFCSALPQAAMSWALWERLSKKFRLISLPVPALMTAALLALFFLGLNNMNWVGYMHIVTAWVLPAALLATLLAAAVDAVKGNKLLRRLFCYLACSLPVVALAWLVSLLAKGKLAQTLKAAFTGLGGAYPSLYDFCELLCTLLLILCFIQAVLELISGMARQDAELQAMALRERYAAENLEVMRQSQEETRRQRHEMQHHLTLLEDMLAQEETGRAAAYIRSLLDQVASLPSGNYSDNLVVNAIAGYYLNAAKSEGIRVSADIRAKKELPLKDEELCVLLTNLLENALEACRAMGPGEDRFLSLRVSSNRDHILIDCENSTKAQVTPGPDGTIPTSKQDPENHGYGLPAISRIVEKRCGILERSCADGRYKAVITI